MASARSPLGPVNTYFALALGRKEVSYKARNAAITGYCQGA
ncbi:hypothetical protein SAMN02745857_01152 [Andreprevotia lacus DSM 23236]|jgi:hypothetical protein|uniref:Uncharacterized protein n=1 Tax=Andreprevotia lacus DSM 23236 TaxID=1121001 RepID=A0A1W1XAX9_9NEIS|nr:hypothetical protein SAMN02745857_01152 [Andreprevotia lacus DSM 23236]